MMKSMIAENGVTFKELETNIYSWVCEIGRQFTAEFMERSMSLGLIAGLASPISGSPSGTSRPAHLDSDNEQPL